MNRKSRQTSEPRTTMWRRACCTLPWRILCLLLGLVWLLWLLASLVRLCRVASRRRAPVNRNTVPAWAYRQPDPLIYSQQYLQAQGLAVTWDNPDIHIELPSAPGTPVESTSLQPDTDHVVVARIWNGSTTAPAVDLPVKVSYLEFGIGTTRHDVGITTTDLAVKGGADCPAFARVPWRTPTAAGHYCLQVELLWDDDANPANNLGQHNTNVVALNSRHAGIIFALRNDGPSTRLIHLDVDTYQIPPLEPCSPEERADSDQRRRRLLTRHEPAAWPIPDGWQVMVEPRAVELTPGQTVPVTVDITAPDGYAGRQAINVRAHCGPDLIGGVTLYVEGNG